MKGLDLRLPSPLIEVHDELLSARGVRLYLKRDDLIHPELIGNKWRKLKYNLEEARAESQSTLLTFGGAYSNHIRAVATSGYYFDFDTIGIIRGEEHLPLNEFLASAVNYGMQLVYMDRVTYRRKTNPEVIDSLRSRFGDFYLLPEGGSNALALRGCAELVEEIDIEFDTICCSCGTGGTLAGIASALCEEQRALGFSTLKGGSFLFEEVSNLQKSAYGHSAANWSIELDYHFGGFAKRTRELDEFISSFAARHGVTLDWIYEAKMMFGLLDLIGRGEFERGSTIVAVIAG
ncbi:1-aminocyclopropane-1-carboxylate deaminase/D-cysteine desulfhydrase [Amycolatopsis sp. NPDC059021]|uniref:1-aminocyclopropane-1-carboxylate deaminase/D-cysteine desulfhydrase n=1 Tax=Amycolatopsis sp. NPDC059021 TaxID=3346704 RepID=UPI00366A8ADC